jgi:hypothetical protein
LKQSAIKAGATSPTDSFYFSPTGRDTLLARLADDDLQP